MGERVAGIMEDMLRSTSYGGVFRKSSRIAVGDHNLNMAELMRAV